MRVFRFPSFSSPRLVPWPPVVRLPRSSPPRHLCSPPSCPASPASPLLCLPSFAPPQILPAPPGFSLLSQSFPPRAFPTSSSSISLSVPGFLFFVSQGHGSEREAPSAVLCRLNGPQTLHLPQVEHRFRDFVALGSSLKLAGLSVMLPLCWEDISRARSVTGRHKLASEVPPPAAAWNTVPLWVLCNSLHDRPLADSQQRSDGRRRPFDQMGRASHWDGWGILLPPPSPPPPNANQSFVSNPRHLCAFLLDAFNSTASPLGHSTRPPPPFPGCGGEAVDARPLLDGGH